MPSVGTVVNYVVIGLFIAYLIHVSMVMFQLFNPEECIPAGSASKCISPYISTKPKLQLSIYTSVKIKSELLEKDLKLVTKYDNFTIEETFVRSVNVSLPKKTRNNGTLFVHVIVHPHGESALHNRLASYQRAPLTKYAVPRSEEFNLLSEGNKDNMSTSEVPVTHWRPKLVFSVLQDSISMTRNAVPQEILQYIRVTQKGEYLPVLFINNLVHKNRELLQINDTVKEMPLRLTYSPISIGWLRLYSTLELSMKMLRDLGFGEKDTEEVLSLFTDSGLYLLALTMVVSMFHLLFDFLAFKNDISYWRKRNTMAGLSTRTVVWRGVSQIIIFFYLLDQETSYLVLIPAGIGMFIEMWKVKKAFKVQFTFSGIRPCVSFGSTSDTEKATEAIDSQAMQYLSYVLYPLCIAGAGYSLLYVSHKSWYSWLIKSLVNGVYAFGFLFMLPQLFVNYKLKSVAHLPWRAFMYKAFNTFIDDIFAFIITMPTAHRLACFRDDIIFVLYLYQRWLYPVDKKRVNEYGMSFEEKENAVTNEEKENAVAKGDEVKEHVD
ncbi:cleft lip and palate transmembrane protein 1-like protein [Asterias rubens]|uniref:cleft lip and palate transmembrane protein 1-like protein n=1 Tax=Asterias rubens TaxID=7604 RepID=UPI0014555CA0|nr:cleft lip and palate transmembrane protein 1-like protein [Asterias rubens]XP_033626708.1 cleft lip and palate transmembrane protein 1-like protein [Asterias rubens]XP_033626709.1 cleft lip and palate transmembrane protein 1-like protein [Asterias rubens]